MRTQPKSRYGLRQASVPKSDQVQLSQTDSGFVALFNPNHDDKGRFGFGVGITPGLAAQGFGVSKGNDLQAAMNTWRNSFSGSGSLRAVAEGRAPAPYNANESRYLSGVLQEAVAQGPTVPASWRSVPGDAPKVGDVVHMPLAATTNSRSEAEGFKDEVLGTTGHLLHVPETNGLTYPAVKYQASEYIVGGNFKVVSVSSDARPVVELQKVSSKTQLSRYGLKTEPVSVDPGYIALFNPNHDERGRFGVGSSPKTSEHSPQGATIDAKHAVRISPEYQAKSADIVAKVDAGLAAGKDTQSQFDKIDGHVGAYTAERTGQQNQIIDSYLNKPGIAQDHQLIVMGGLPGSGKSSWLNNPDNVARLGMNPKTFVTVNSDDIKGNMQAMGMSHPAGAADYSGLGLKQNEATGLVHEESADIAGRLNYTSMARGNNTMLDVTLNSSAQFDKKVSNMEAATGNDYRTTLVFVDTNKATSMDRAAARYWKDGAQTGRFIPISNIGNVKTASDSGFTMNRQAYESLKTTPAVDRAILVNADGKVVEDTGWKK